LPAIAQHPCIFGTALPEYIKTRLTDINQISQSNFCKNVLHRPCANPSRQLVAPEAGKQ